MPARSFIMKIAALYARVSTTNQQQDETIASQLDALMAYAHAHDDEISPHHIYQDDGFSGASVDRPALDALRDAVATGELEAVLILSPDRLARQFAYQYVITEEFEQAGCEVVFVNHGLGQTPSERMLREMAGVFAEYERAQIAERCRRGRLYQARPGHVWMSQAPYGYTYVPKTEACPGRLIINETEAEVGRHLFHWVVDDPLSTYQMTKRINETGWRTRKGTPHWSAGYIRNLLGNSVYRGIYYYNKRKLVQATRRNMPAEGPLKPRRTGRVVRPQEEWIAIEVPAIIDPETWELAQQQLRLNRERSPRNTKKHAYLLQSLLICSYCQVRMVGHTTGRPDNPNRRYLCGRKDSLKGHPTRCPARTFSGDRLEEQVWASVSGLLRDPHLLLEQYQIRPEPGYGSPQQHEQNRLERRQKALSREEERLIDAYQAGVMELEALSERCGRIRDERARVMDRLSQLQRQQLEQAQYDTLGQTLDEFCRKMSDMLDNPSFETKQRILRLVVDKILVSDEEITIQHTVPISDVRLWRDHYSRREPMRRYHSHRADATPQI
jgi:site-specific DNA recombinase